MKDSRWQPERYRGGVGGYKADERRRKRAIRLWIGGGLLVAAILIVCCWLLLFRRPAAEQNAAGAGQKIRTGATAVTSEKKEEVRRKNIYDRNLRELAISFKVDSIYVKPLEFDNIERTVALLAQTLGLDEKEVLEELKTQRTFKWVAKRISPEQAVKVMALHLPGVYFYEQEQRFDPNRANTAAIIGEVKDEHGLSGIELFYDNLLLNPAADSQPTKAGGGGRGIVLTLDARIQLLMEQEMTQLRSELKATGTTAEDLTGISAIIMDAATGGILSYVRLPFFGGRQPTELNGLESGDRIFSGTINPGPLAAIFKAAAELEQGLTTAASASSAEESTPSEGGQPAESQVVKKFIEERTAREKPKEKTAKEAAGPQPKSPWGKLPDGAYATEWLAGLMARQLAAAPGARADFSDFGKMLSRVGPCKVDLPGENGGRDTGIGMLCGFAALVNGGAGVTPHFLKAILAADGKPEEWPWPPLVNKVIGLEASRGLVLFLREVSHPAGQVFFADVLRPGAATAAGPAPDQVDQKETAAAPAAQAAAAGAAGGAAHGPQEKPEKPTEKGQPGEEAKPAEVTVLDRCDILALAAAPLAKPELVMLIAANDAAIDLTKPSALRRHAEAALSAALRLYHQREAGMGAAESFSRQEIFQRWLMKNKLLGFDVAAGFKGDKETMIDVRGMSIRKALQELNRFDVKIVIEGSGLVKRQHPAPGGKVAEGSVVILKAEAKR